MVQWLYLSDVALIQVFSYLSDEDRARAARVCSRWRRIFQTPQLWRTRTLEMGGANCLINGARAYKFTEHFGQYLKSLTISCSQPSIRTCKLFQRCLGTLLSLLSEKDTQLYEFELCRLNVERYWRFNTSREKLAGLLSKFFKGQKFLKGFDMSSGSFPTLGGCRILGSVSHSSGGQVQDLIIEDFFHPSLAIYQENRFIMAMSRFTNIEYLSLNYNCLSEEIIEMFTKTLQNKLAYLTVKVSRFDPHQHRISGYAWKQLSLACPKLSVAFWFGFIGQHWDIVGILSREIPLKEFHLWTGYNDMTDWQLGLTLEYVIKCYSNSLVTVSLEMDNSLEIVDSQILDLVTKGKELRELTVNAIVDIDTIKKILQLQRRRKIDLTLFHVTCCGITEHDRTRLGAVTKQYQRMINRRGLNYIFTTEPLMDTDQ